MPTVTFGTGQRVTFDKMPSQQDIQEVATKLNIDSPSSSQSSSGGIGQTLWNGAKNIASNIVSAPITLAARVGQLGGVGIAGAASKLTGNQDYYNNAIDAMNQPNSFAGVPIKPVSQETPESIVGEGLSTVALGAPGAGKLSIPAASALTGAMAGAGSSMQDNASPLRVATNTAIGGLLGYGTGALTQGITSRLKSPSTMENYLSQSGVADTRSASKIANALRDVGINDLSSKEAVINAQNTLGRNILAANNYLTTNGALDSVSGELNAAGQRWTSRLDALKYLNSLLPGVQKYVNAITPNLLRHGLIGATSALTGAGLLTNAIPKAASYLKDRFVGQLPNFANQ